MVSYPTYFKSNILALYGAHGKAWLERLSALASAVAKRYKLSALAPVANLSFNYVLAGVQGDQPIILKLGLDQNGLRREAAALKAFAGCGAIEILVEGEGLLLLERASPGTSLKEYSPRQDAKAVEIACQVMQRLHQAPLPPEEYFPSIADWLRLLDKEWEIPAIYLNKARQRRDHLLTTSGPSVLLHGDLHHDNILRNGNEWVAIDPKGVIGEATYEVASFIRNPMPELLNHDDAPNIIQSRITRFAEILKLPSRRILDWCFVQAVLSWAWALEDSLDTSCFEQLTRIFETICRITISNK